MAGNWPSESCRASRLPYMLSLWTFCFDFLEHSSSFAEIYSFFCLWEPPLTITTLVTCPNPQFPYLSLKIYHPHNKCSSRNFKRQVPDLMSLHSSWGRKPKISKLITQFIKDTTWEFPHGSGLTNPTSIHEDVGSILGLAQ